MKNPFNRTSSRAIRAFALFAVLATARLASAGTDIWIGQNFSDANWMTAANWNNNTVPKAGDSLYFTVNNYPDFNTYNNFPTTPSSYYFGPLGTAFDGIYFTNGEEFEFVLTGNPVLLSGAAAGNIAGVSNSTDYSQEITLPLQLDWGYHTFSAAVSPLILNNSILPLPGAVACFVNGPWLESSSASLDPSGLIAGLGGEGLMVSSSSANPALLSPPLATVSGGNIVQYTGYTSLSGGGTGFIPNISTANVELADTAGAAYTIPSSISVNTITTDKNPGNSGGTQTITINNTGTLTLGNQGGIYVTGAGSGSKQIFELTGGSLTASPAQINDMTVNGVIVLGINGTTSTKQMQLDSVVIDDGGSPVTLVETGPGAMELSQPNTYSGGTYIDQGFLETIHSAGLGTGPVYVANNAEVFLEASGGTWVNEFYISPGAGPSYSTDGAIKMGNGGTTQTIQGTLNLLGHPVTSAPGDRIGMTGNGGTVVLGGQITGPGTLELLAGAAQCNFVLQNSSDQPNNWTGGLLIDNAGNNQSIVFDGDEFINNQLAGNNVMLAQSGTGVAQLALINNDTIGGLSAASSPNNQVVGEPDFFPTVLTVGAGNATATFGGVISDNGGANTLSIVKIGTGTQTFTGANTYSGSTVIQGGTLALVGPGSIAGSPINVSSGGTFDVSGVSSPPFVLNTGHVLSGGGQVAGDVIVGTFLDETTAIIHPGGAGLTSTILSFLGNLTFSSSTSSAGAIFDLSSSHSGPNDRIALAGVASTLYANGAQIGINPEGTLDMTHDYVLIDQTSTGFGIVGIFNSTPAWYGTPLPNASQWSIVTTSSEVSLHYSPPPPIAFNQTMVTLENTAVAVTLTGSDPNQLPLTYTVTTPPYLGNITGPATGPLSGNAPDFTFTPGSQTGLGGFQFKVNNGALDSAPATVTIIVVATGQSLNVSATAPAGQSVTVTLPPESGQAGVMATLNNTSGNQETVTATDYSANPETAGVFKSTTSYLDLQVSGATAGDSMTAQFSAPGAPPPASGPSLYYFDPANGSWPLVLNGTSAPSDAGEPPTPVPDGSGNWVFTVYFDDTSMPTLADLTGTVFALGAFAPPVPGTNQLGTVENTAVTVSVAQLLAGASSPNGGVLDISAPSANSAQGGTVTLAAGLVTYLPPGGYVGADSFTYTLSDGYGTAQGTVQAVVTSSTAPPLNYLSVATANGNMALQYSGVPGQTYVVQSASVVTGPWTDLSGDLTAGSDGLVTNTISGPLMSEQYFRVRTGP